MPWSEIPNSNEGRSDDTNAEVIRTFKVWGVNKAQVYIDPTAILKSTTDPEPLPAKNSLHPEVPGAKLDAYAITASESPDIFEAQALYSTNGAFRLPRGLPEGFLAYGGDAVPSEIALPFAYRDYGVDPEGKIIGGWKSAELSTTSVLARRVARVSVPLSELTETIKAFIDEQVGNIHAVQVGSFVKKYQFIGWRHSQVTLDTVDVEYEWAADPGTLPLPWVVVSSVFEDGTGREHLSYYFPIAGNGGIPLSPPGFPYDVGGGRTRRFVRKPYHTLQMTLPPDDTAPGIAGEPAFDNQPVGADDLAAWSAFPGLIP